MPGGGWDGDTGGMAIPDTVKCQGAGWVGRGGWGVQMTTVWGGAGIDCDGLWSGVVWGVGG
jgi:hypothetical protein